MSAMTSQLGEPTTPRLKKEDIGFPTDFRHVEHHGLPLDDTYSDIESPLVSLVEHDRSQLGDERADTSASTTEVDGEDNISYEIIMEPTPVPPPLPPKPDSTKRKAPKPPSQTKTTKSSKFTNIFGGWKALKPKAHSPKPTSEKDSPKTNIKTPLPPPTPSNGAQTRDMAVPSVAPAKLRKAPPVPKPKTSINVGCENKTTESILEIQKIAAMVTLKLINRYPDDYMEERRKSEETEITTIRLSDETSNNPSDLVVANDRTISPEEDNIYEDISLKVMQNIYDDQKELVSVSQDFSTMFQEVLKEVQKEDDSEVLLKGGVSRASSRRRNSALNALDTVIMSFLSEDEETCGESDQVGGKVELVETFVSDNDVNETRDVEVIKETSMRVGTSQNLKVTTSETENQSIYEDILQEIPKNSNDDPTLQSKQMPTALPRTFLKENISDNKDGNNKPTPKVPPRPTPRPILRVDNTTTVDATGAPSKQHLKAYLEEFYEDVTPKQMTEPANSLTTENCDTITVTLGTIRLGSAGTIADTPVKDIDKTSPNCVETDSSDGQLMSSDMTSKELGQLNLEKEHKMSECGQDDFNVDVVLSKVEIDFVTAPSNDLAEIETASLIGITGDVTVFPNREIDLDTATLKEKSADLAASLIDGEDGAADRKHSMLTWDVDTCVTLATVEDRELKLLLMKAGVTDDELKDRATRDFILQFINEHGGKDKVKKEVMFLTTLSARRNRRPKKKLLEVVHISIDGDTQDDDESTYM